MAEETEAQAEKIKKKIMRLKRMSDSARSVKSFAEAETAARLMQKLLDEYNLSLESIDFEGTCRSTEETGFTHEKVRMAGKWTGNDTWVRLLRGTVCKYCYCISLSSGQDLSCYEVVGRHENIAAAKWLIEYLSSAFVSLFRKRYRKYLIDRMLGKEKSVPKNEFRSSYLSGCVAGLRENFENNWEKAEEPSRRQDKKEFSCPETQCSKAQSGFQPTPRSIVIRQQSRLRDYLYEIKGKKIPTAEIDGGYNSEVPYSYGFADGRSISLNRQIE